MATTKTITITCDTWDAPRRLALTPSLTTAQILRHFGLNTSGALIHQRTTTEPRSGLTVQQTWMARDKPYKSVLAGDVLQAVSLVKPKPINNTDQSESTITANINNQPST